MSASKIAHRRALLALILAILLPGLGQLYNGQLNKGVFLFLCFVLISTPFLALVVLMLPAAWLMPLLILSLAATLGLYAYGIWDAWRTARRALDYRPHAWQQPALYVSLLLFAYLVVISGSTAYVRRHLVESFRIPTDSMTPNLLRGDVLFADKRINCRGCDASIQRGEIAIFVYPNDRTLLYIKRVIGLPGDNIRISGRTISVNDQPITLEQDARLVYEHGDNQDYKVHWPLEAEAVDFSLRVPPGEIFLLGDNRTDSVDSRTFGTVPLRDVIGRAGQIWFSYTPASGVRWERLGKVL